jgi:alkylresorcinol/alkylpyrone synthase
VKASAGNIWLLRVTLHPFAAKKGFLMQPRLLAIKTAVPPFVLSQKDVVATAKELFSNSPEVLRLLPVFENAAIGRRYSCVPIDWYRQSHGWIDRTALYADHAVALFETLTRELAADARIGLDEIDAIVTVSTTGISTPSLDALIVERLGLRRDIQRLPIFGLGCAGGIIGLARAADIAKAHPGKKILFLAVELCALTFRRDDISKSNIVATALFGDGAAGAILSTDGEGPFIAAAGEHTWPQSLDVMGWDIEEDGLKARFAQNIPALVSRDMRTITDASLARHGLALKDIDGFACHPGGAKVLDALEQVFDFSAGALADSRAVLNDYGNMSSVTVLFVLARMNWRKTDQRILMTSLGPGFSAALLLLES